LVSNPGVLSSRWDGWTLTSDGTQATLQTLFPGFGGWVFARWFTGTIRIPRGRRLHVVYNRDGSVLKREEMLEIERGVIRKT
jgi:hypothetical protein